MTVREFEQVTMAALKSGNVQSYCRCYDLFFKPLCSFANSMIRNPAAAEEMIQGLFLEIWQDRENLPDHSSLKAFFFTAVRNDCLDYLKHKDVERKYADEVLAYTSHSQERILSELIDQELQHFLEVSLDKLPERCREVFVLSRYHYLSYKEIAEKLTISVKTVENQIANALKILRKELDHLL